MSVPSLDLDNLQQEMLVLLPTIDLSSLCCCIIIDPSLGHDQHLDDCELRCLDGAEKLLSTRDSLTEPSSASVSMTGSPMAADHTEKRRKHHRESMARLRHGWRTSIAALQQQEQQLQDVLRRLVVAPPSQDKSDDTPCASPLETLRQSYRELVQEQLRLQDEHANLMDTQSHNDKYERLLQRELVRIRTFQVIDSNESNK